MNPLMKFDRIRNALFSYLERQSKKILFAWALALASFTGTLDYFTGGYSFISFYLIPIFLASWFVSRTAGNMTCIISFVASLLANPYRYVLHHYAHPSFYYWDLFLEFAYLILLSLMFSTLKNQFNTAREMSRMDSLTGALNRRALFELATYEIAQCSRHARALSLAFIDLDNFKTVNDQRGHAEGDKVLCEVVTSLKETLRQADTVARVGGDEFVVMLPETDDASAEEIMQKIQVNLLSTMKKNDWPVTFSIGLTTHESPQVSADEMINQADRMMYSIKNKNKNGIVHHVVRNKKETV